MDQAFKNGDLVSIVVPAYEEAMFLRDFSLPSAIAQTYRNWELIVVDDGSRDENVRKVAEDLAAKDPRISYIRHERNLGLAATYNTGIAKAKGGLVAFLEQDDVWFPEKLARQTAAMAADPGGICSTCRCWLMDLDTMKIFGTGPAVFSGFMIRRKALAELGPLDESPELRGLQDGDLKAMLDLRYAAQNPGYYLTMDDPLIIFVRREGSLSSRSAGARKFMERYGTMCAKYDRPELAARKELAPLLNFWYAHLAFNAILVGERVRARSAARKALAFVDNGTAKMVLRLSYCPSRIARTLYTASSVLKKTFGPLTIRWGERRYNEEYKAARAIIAGLPRHGNGPGQ